MKFNLSIFFFKWTVLQCDLFKKSLSTSVTYYLNTFIVLEIFPCWYMDGGLPPSFC